MNINDGTQRYTATPSVRIVLLIGTSLHKTCISLSKTLRLDGGGGVMITSTEAPRFFWSADEVSRKKKKSGKKNKTEKHISQNSRCAYLLLLSEIYRNITNNETFWNICYQEGDIQCLNHGMNRSRQHEIIWSKSSTHQEKIMLTVCLPVNSKCECNQIEVGQVMELPQKNHEKLAKRMLNVVQLCCKS